MAYLKIKPFKKVYTDDDGDAINMQPIICSECGYDSAMDSIEEYNFCPNCGAPIEGIRGILIEDKPDDNFAG